MSEWLNPALNTSMQIQNLDRYHRACCSLEGLSVGDAFGERFFVHPDIAEQLIAERALPTPPWAFTDDTNMALSIVSILSGRGTIDQPELARSFAERYEYTRGYGPAMHRALGRIREGEPWKEVAQGLFAGQGSYGNGAAMRVAPLGAYFADDMNAVVEQAAGSAEITHAHEEAIAGAIAVAVAAAWAWRIRDTKPLPGQKDFLDLVLPLVPISEVHSKIRRGRDMGPDTSVHFAVAVLGNGEAISAQDTVPFALWCASKCLGDFAEALWLTVSGLGDRDTTCAIVGGIVAMVTDVVGIPAEWRQSREALPDWPFQEKHILPNSL